MSCSACEPGLLGWFRSKIGRCSRCMKQTFTGTVLSWGAVALLRFAAPVGRWWLVAAVCLATAFSALWLAHIIAYARRRMRATAAYHESAGMGVSRRAFFGTGAKAAAVAVAASIPVACDYLGAKIIWCDCYFDSDCGHFFYCRYDVDCSWVPKGTPEDDPDGRPPCPGDSSAGSCDGLCKFLKLPYSVVGRDAVANVADLYFQAYLRAADGQTVNGEPDPGLLAQARAVDLPGDAHQALTGAIFSALDLTAGWDFAVGLRDMSDPERPGIKGFFRGLPEGVARVVDAARTGFVASIRSGQPEAILPPIRAFWTEFPDYHPNHGGRCYPHGHLQYPTALGCQEANLLKLATALNVGDEA